MPHRLFTPSFYFAAVIVRLVTGRFIGDYDPSLEAIYSYDLPMGDSQHPLQIMDTAVQVRTPLQSQSSPIFIIKYQNMMQNIVLGVANVQIILLIPCEILIFLNLLTYFPWVLACSHNVENFLLTRKMVRLLMFPNSLFNFLASLP